MSAARKDLPPPSGGDQLGEALRRRYARPSAPASADEPTGPSTGDSADQPTDAPARRRARPPASERTRVPASGRTRAPARVEAQARDDAPAGAVGAAEARTEAPATRETPEAPSGPVVASGTRRELDVAARSYRAGLARLQPRADRLADAVRGMLAAGGSVADVAALLDEAGLTERDLPADVRALLSE